MSITQSKTLETPATRKMLGRGALYDVLALAFSYPDDDTVAELRAGIDALREGDLMAPFGDALALEALAAALEQVEPPALAATYNLYFAGEVPCSLNETEYEADGFAKARRLADIAGFYHAFGLQVPDTRPAPADSLATEMEFMSHTVMRQAYAALHGWDEQRQICEDAQRAFLEDHLGRWAPLFSRTLFDLVEGDGFYAAAAALCEQFITAEIQTSGADPRPATARRVSSNDAEAFTCMFDAASEEEKEDAP